MTERLYVDPIEETLRYQKRRNEPVPVEESEAGPVAVMAFCTSEPGRYASDGHTIFPERRRFPRPKN